ncbi:hypothetical protein [Microcoleus sp. CAWBG58]|uniref:hypothetical protein n=1 Tax=Microcoleus sp. CAWBG58 TaxID=2841651 RepID=UPI0025EDC3BD|nr:hypothetical protein [Microcoleus sp. CAWBG58]
MVRLQYAIVSFLWEKRTNRSIFCSQGFAGETFLTVLGESVSGDRSSDKALGTGELGNSVSEFTEMG